MLYYYLTIALQVYCLYHIFKNKNDYYWYFIVFLIPIIGCIIYIFTQVINKRDLTILNEEISTIINPTRKIKNLEDKLQFSDTFQNRIELADAYMENQDFEKAILNFETSLKSNFNEDAYTINKLIICYFNIENYDKVIEYSNKINLDKDFKGTIYYYGLALEKKGEFVEAENQLRKVDQRYSNYEERLILCNFLIRRNKVNEAKEILQEILLEGKNMTKVNRKKHKSVISQAEKILQGI